MYKIIAFFAILGLAVAGPVAPRNLNDDLQEFVDLIPVEEIDGIFKEYLATDAGTAAVIEYLQSDEFHDLADKVVAYPEVQDLIKFITDAGIPVDELISEIHDVIENAVPGVAPDQTASLRPLLDAIEATLPVADLVTLLFNKLQSSPDMQELYLKLSSEETHELANTVLALSDVQDLLDRLRAVDVHVDTVLALIYDFLGWGPLRIRA